MRIASVIIFHLSKLWKAKFSMLCDVTFLARLQGKLDFSLLGVKGLTKQNVNKPNNKLNRKNNRAATLREHIREKASDSCYT